MDDFLDAEEDSFEGRHNIAQILGVGVFPYALLLFSFGVMLQPTLVLALFWASYIVGMGKGLQDSYPSRLKGWQETLIVFATGIIFIKVRIFLWAVVVIAAVQLIDDLIDDYGEKSKFRGEKSLCREEVILLAGIMLLLSIWLEPVKTIFVLLASLIIFLLAGGENNGISFCSTNNSFFARLFHGKKDREE